MPPRKRSGRARRRRRSRRCAPSSASTSLRICVMAAGSSACCQAIPGQSLANNMPVSELIGTRLPKSLLLAGAAAIVSVPIALLIGVLAAMYRGSRLDRALSVTHLVDGRSAGVSGGDDRRADIRGAVAVAACAVVRTGEPFIGRVPARLRDAGDDAQLRHHRADGAHDARCSDRPARVSRTSKWRS